MTAKEKPAMQFLPLNRAELEATLLVLSRALEEDVLPAPERAAIRSVLQKVGATKVIEDLRFRAEEDERQLALGFVLPCAEQKGA